MSSQTNQNESPQAQAIKERYRQILNHLVHKKDLDLSDPEVQQALKMLMRLSKKHHLTIKEKLTVRSASNEYIQKAMEEFKKGLQKTYDDLEDAEKISRNRGLKIPFIGKVHTSTG